MSNPLMDVRIGTMVNIGSPEAAKQIISLKKYGFESFSVVLGATAMDKDLPAIANAIKEAIGDDDIVVSSVCVYGNPLESGDIETQTRESWALLAKSTALFGCDIVAGFAGRVRGCSIPDSMPRFAEVFGPIAKIAADHGARLAFENCDMGGTWANGDWNIAHTPAAWDLMFNAVPMDNIGLQWEPCHQMVKLIDPIPQLRKYVKRVFCLHGKDATVMWDVVKEHGIHGSHPFAYHRTPGFGDSNWTDIISILRLGGFKGSIDIEGWHDPVYRGELEIAGQARGCAYLKECRGGCVNAPYPG